MQYLKTQTIHIFVAKKGCILLQINNSFEIILLKKKDFNIFIFVFQHVRSRKLLVQDVIHNELFSWLT